MQRHIVTFRYVGISHPDTCDELTGWPAYRQFALEYDLAAEFLPATVLGTRVLEHNLEAMRVHVQFVTDESVTREALCDLIQTCMYDEGGLSGCYQMGRVVPWEVSREEYVVRTCTVFAESEEEAAKLASAGGKVLSCVPARTVPT
jgi:hypothetical protein